mgnify:CR=1 FL=1
MLVDQQLHLPLILELVVRLAVVVIEQLAGVEPELMLANSELVELWVLLPISHPLPFPLELALPKELITMNLRYLRDHDNDEVSFLNWVILESFIVLFHHFTVCDQLHQISLHLVFCLDLQLCLSNLCSHNFDQKSLLCRSPRPQVVVACLGGFW